MQGVRRRLLARAGPAQNQHGMGVGGIVLDEFFHRPHGRAVADDASNIVMGVVFRLEAAVVMLQLFCQEIDFAVQLAQFRRIREKNMRNHARDRAVAVAHRDSVDHEFVVVAEERQGTEIAHFRAAVFDDHRRAGQGIQVRQRSAQNGFDVAAQQGGIALVDFADDVIGVAVKDALGQGIQHALIEQFGTVPLLRHTPSIGSLGKGGACAAAVAAFSPVVSL